MRHFFAPLPPVHVHAAREVIDRLGKVALGSSQDELVLGLNGQRATIWIGASTGYVPEGGVPGVKIGKVLFRGEFDSADWCDARGGPKQPELRPASTADDGVWRTFYVVRNVVPLERPVASANLRTISGARIYASPHALVEIRPPEGQEA